MREEGLRERDCQGYALGSSCNCRTSADCPMNPATPPADDAEGLKQWWRDFWTVVWIGKVDFMLGLCAIASLLALAKWMVGNG